MARISRQTMFMQMSRIASMRATCHRLNVGAMVVYENNPISVGYNGAPSGHPHCGGNDCPGMVPGNCGTLHAEVNALTKANTLLMEISRPRVDLFVTHSPCQACCEFMLTSSLNVRVRRLFFEIPYRSTQHLSMFTRPECSILFDEQPVEVYEVTPAGYIVEYFTRKVTELP
jgi:dCMP deaminase